MMTIHQSTTLAITPAAFTKSNSGHVHSHAGTVRRPVIAPRTKGAYSASNLLGFRSSVVCSIGDQHLTRLRPNFSAYLNFRLQKDAALRRNDHDRVGLYR